MIYNPTIFALLAGLASGGIFAFSSAFTSAGALLIYLSLFPLLLLGLSFGVRLAGIAAVIGCIVAGILVQASDGLFYPLLVALPVMLFVRFALKWRGEEASREWYPVLRIIAILTVMAAGIYMSLSLLASHIQPGGLQGIASRELAGDVTGSDKDIANTVKLLLGDWLFLLLAGTGWLWLLSLYALAAIANNMLFARKFALRPHLALEPRGLPAWLLGLLAVSAFFAFMGTGNDRLNGETVFLLLLLPYFFAGMARIHQVSRQWPARAFLLTFIYFLLMFPPWMALIAVILGLYGQLAEVLDKRTELS